MKSNSGKVLTVFLVIIAILLISLTTVSLFFFQKETEKRKMTELLLEKARTDVLKFENEVRDLKKSKFLLEEKNKEADDRINSLLDEVELQKGLAEEIKAESSKLKEQLAKEIQEKEALQKSVQGFGSVEEIQQTKIKLEAEMNLRMQAEAQVKELQERIQSIEPLVGKSFDQQKNAVSQEIKKAQEQVNLEKIVVAPNDIPEGRILTVDSETEFVIINLGQKDGVKVGMELSVYRGKDYLGDAKVTRVQSEMSAADFIPPFSSRQTRKNDQVVSKR